MHSELRLAIMSILMNVDKADFPFLKEKTQATSGNLSVQLDKLEKAGYIKINKRFKGKMPQTLCKMTNSGREAFEKYVRDLKSYLSL